MQHATALISQSAMSPAALRSFLLFEALSHDQLLRLAADSVLVHYDAGVIRVQICDTGIGIPVDIRDRIFLPFFTNIPVGVGVGMGLDLAWRTIVGRHHGSLGAASVPGDTRITACLPVHGATPTKSQA